MLQIAKTDIESFVKNGHTHIHTHVRMLNYLQKMSTDLNKLTVWKFSERRRVHCEAKKKEYESKWLLLQVPCVPTDELFLKGALSLFMEFNIFCVFDRFYRDR